MTIAVRKGNALSGSEEVSCIGVIDADPQLGFLAREGTRRKRYVRYSYFSERVSYRRVLQTNFPLNIQARFALDTWTIGNDKGNATIGPVLRGHIRAFSQKGIAGWTLVR